MEMKLGPFSYVLAPSAFGALSIVWWEIETGPKVYRLFLPDEQTPAEDVIQMNFPGASSLSCPAIAELGERVQRFLAGESIELNLGLLALERYSEFQRKVLLAEHEVPRGWVSTYGRIAKSLGTPRAARAVGNALARNPFPVIIPCHRTIRADGRLGGYQGGLNMKRALLEMEGVEVDDAGSVLTDQFYY
ncbi:MAG TPA: methylated-DNA--[protein]-cysteine S-methyltransferase [Thermoflexia bacterium]|nr:methylated-DNA--[protein]-cysteine S-methyltransferase [Thermoflexia bacterium]